MAHVQQASNFGSIRIGNPAHKTVNNESETLQEFVAVSGQSAAHKLDACSMYSKRLCQRNISHNMTCANN
jgi:hypothetical protein